MYLPSAMTPAASYMSLRRLTCHVVPHTCYIFVCVVDSMFANHLQLVVLGQAAALAYMYSNYMQTTVFRGTSKAMYALQDTHTFNAGMMLAVGVPRLAGHVALQSRGIPDFDCLVVRA